MLSLTANGMPYSGGSPAPVGLGEPFQLGGPGVQRAGVEPGDPHGVLAAGGDPLQDGVHDLVRAQQAAPVVRAQPVHAEG